MDLETLLEKLDIGESQDFECKRAEDNVPKDAWKSISAFANTEGGYVVLGVAEKKGRFQILGVNNFISENIDLNITKVALPMVSFIPEDIEQELRKLVGDNYRYLQELDRIILLLAHRFGEISNNGIQGFSQKHPRDIGDRLKYLVENRWLQKYGHGRGTYYCLPTSDISKALLLNQNIQVSVSSSDHLREDSDHLRRSSDHLEESSDHLSENSDDIEKLKAIARPVREKRKVSADVMRQAILEVCKERFLTLQQLEVILDRTNSTLRTRFLKKMVEEGLIELRYPDKPSHPEQAYRTKT